MFNWLNILDKKLISKRVYNTKDKTFTIDERPFNKDEDKNYIKNLDEQTKNKEEELNIQIPSTAIKNARYKNGRIYIKYVGGNKEYVFAGDKKVFNDLLNSGSKGRYVEKVMKLYNRAPASWYK